MNINFYLRRTIRFFGGIRLALGSVLFAGFAAAIIVLFFFAWLTGEMLDGDAAQFDHAVREFVHRFAAPALTSVMRTASFLGSTLFLILAGAAVFIIFHFLNRRRAALIFIITTIGSAVLLVALKSAFRRARPEPFFDTILPASYSFPSGHSLASFCFYGALAAIIAARVDRLWLKVVVWISSGFLIALIGVSRVYLGVHHPSDVLAGFAVGFIWVVTIAVGDRLIHARDKRVLDGEKSE